MHSVSVNQHVRAPRQRVFASWSDEFNDIYKFNPNLRHSRAVAGGPADTGLGSLRQCDLADGRNWIREKIIGFRQDQQLVIDIYDGSLPLKSAVATFDFESTSDGGTQVTMTMDFEPKFGVIGALMAPLLKRRFRVMLKALLRANARYVEDGTTVSDPQQVVESYS